MFDSIFESKRTPSMLVFGTTTVIFNEGNDTRYAIHGGFVGRLPPDARHVAYYVVAVDPAKNSFQIRCGQVCAGNAMLPSNKTMTVVLGKTRDFKERSLEKWSLPCGVLYWQDSEVEDTYYVSETMFKNVLLAVGYWPENDGELFCIGQVRCGPADVHLRTLKDGKWDGEYIWESAASPFGGQVEVIETQGSTGRQHTLCKGRVLDLDGNEVMPSAKGLIEKT